MSMEGLHSQEGEKERIPDDVEELVRQLGELSAGKYALEYDGTTYEIDANDFTLSFTLDQNEGRFEIRNIEASGLGGTIVDTINTYADENGLEVYASNVRESAQGFWRKMGYEESGVPGEFFRPEQ